VKTNTSVKLLQEKRVPRLKYTFYSDVGIPLKDHLLSGESPVLALLGCCSL